MTGTRPTRPVGGTAMNTAMNTIMRTPPQRVGR